MVWDSLIVGKGPAGISAALYLQRAGFSTIVVGKDFGSPGKSGIRGELLWVSRGDQRKKIG